MHKYLSVLQQKVTNEKIRSRFHALSPQAIPIRGDGIFKEDLERQGITGKAQPLSHHPTQAPEVQALQVDTGSFTDLIAKNGIEPVENEESSPKA